MNFLDYYLSVRARLKAIRWGLGLGLCSWLIFDWKIGVLVGAVVALLASFIVPLVCYCRDIPYIKIKKTLSVPFLIDERVHFSVKNGTVSGFMVLTEKKLVLLSLEQGDHRLELAKEDISHITFDEAFTMNVFLNEKRFVKVISEACDEFCEILQQNGWYVSTH